MAVFGIWRNTQTECILSHHPNPVDLNSNTNTVVIGVFSCWLLAPFANQLPRVVTRWSQGSKSQQDKPFRLLLEECPVHAALYMLAVSGVQGGEIDGAILQFVDCFDQI